MQHMIVVKQILSSVILTVTLMVITAQNYTLPPAVVKNQVRTVTIREALKHTALGQKIQASLYRRTLMWIQFIRTVAAYLNYHPKMMAVRSTKRTEL